MFRKLISAAIVALVATSMAHAQSSQPSNAAAATTSADACKAKAVGKNGKPLQGAALNSFMKKCQRDPMGNECEAKAIGKDGKPLSGAAKSSFMKKCMASPQG